MLAVYFVDLTIPLEFPEEYLGLEELAVQIDVLLGSGFLAEGTTISYLWTILGFLMSDFLPSKLAETAFTSADFSFFLPSFLSPAFIVNFIIILHELKSVK